MMKMRSLFPTTDVLLKLPVSVSIDPLGVDVVEYREVIVKGCLVIGKSSTDLKFPAERLDETYIRVDLPIYFKDRVAGGIVVFLDEEYEIIGDPIKNPYTPLEWDRNVLARRI